MAYQIDPIYSDPNAEYANEDPIGGTGNELAANRPGFIYMDPRAGAAGEAAARAEWNNAPGPVEPPDMTGNAIAAKRNMEWDTRHAIAQAQRDIEDSYYHAKSIGEMNSARAAEEHLRQRSIADSIASGMPLDEVVLQHGVGGYTGSGVGSALKAIAPQKPFHIGDALVQVGPGGVPKEIYRSKPQGLSQLDSMQLSRAMAAKQAAQLALADPLKGAVSPEKYQAIIDQNQAIEDSIINRVNPQATTPYAPKPSPPVQPAENRVTTKQHFDALKSGDVYVGKDGKKYRKP